MEIRSLNSSVFSELQTLRLSLELSIRIDSLHVETNALIMKNLISEPCSNKIKFLPIILD